MEDHPLTVCVPVCNKHNFFTVYKQTFQNLGGPLHSEIVFRMNTKFKFL